MGKILRIILPVEPRAHQETRFVPGSNIVYNSKENISYKKELRSYLINYSGFFSGEEYIQALFIFAFRRPKFIKTRDYELIKNRKPDWDNLCKPVCDVLASHKIFRQGKKDVYGAGVVENDSNIFDARAIKIYCNSDQLPHIRIYLKAVTNTLFTIDEHIRSFYEEHYENQLIKNEGRLEQCELFEQKANRNRSLAVEKPAGCLHATLPAGLRKNRFNKGA